MGENTNSRFFYRKHVGDRRTERSTITWAELGGSVQGVKRTRSRYPPPNWQLPTPGTPVRLGAIPVLRSAFSWKFDPHLPPRNANNVESYTFVTTPPPHPLLRYVTLEWPLSERRDNNFRQNFPKTTRTKVKENSVRPNAITLAL